MPNLPCVHPCLQVRDLLAPLVQPWVPLVCGVLSSDPSARASWPAKLAALRLGHAVATYFNKPLAAAMPPLMGAAWQLLLALQVCPAVCGEQLQSFLQPWLCRACMLKIAAGVLVKAAH